MNAYVELLRLHHWLKNLTVFLPLFVCGLFWCFEYWPSLLLAFIIIGLASSAGYVFNDLSNYEDDLKHPDKRFRPLPSGRVSFPIACLAWLIFFLAASFASLLSKAFWFVCPFLLADIFYTGFARQHPPLDIATIAAKYPLRLAIGYMLISRPFNWYLAIAQMGYIVALTAMTRKGDNRHNQSEYQLRLIFCIGIFLLLLFGGLFIFTLPTHLILAFLPLSVLVANIIYFEYLFDRATYEDTKSLAMLRHPMYLVLYGLLGLILYFAIYGVPFFA